MTSRSLIASIFLMPLTFGKFSWNNLMFCECCSLHANTWFSWNRKLQLMAWDDIFQVMVDGVNGVTGQIAPNHAVEGFKLGRETATILFQSRTGGSVRGWALKSSAVTQTTVQVGRWRLWPSFINLSDLRARDVARKDTRVIHESFLLYMVHPSVGQIMTTVMTETDHQLIKHEFLRKKTCYILSSECKTLL